MIVAPESSPGSSCGAGTYQATLVLVISGRLASNLPGYK